LIEKYDDLLMTNGNGFMADHLTDDDMRPANIKVAISMRMSADVLDAYRERAKKLGIGYQTLMQMKLREGLEKDRLEARVTALEARLRAPKQRRSA
jgi:uncharacterized protein (DUF4415 family)